MNYMRKTNLLKITCLLLIVLFQKNAECQQNFKDGYVVNLNNDTVKGQINYRNWDKNPTRVEFRKDAAAKAVYYKPIEINAFNVAEENYISAIVSVEKSPYKTNELSNSADFEFVKDTVFLEVLATGNKPIYYLKDNDGKINFFIRGDNGIEILLYKEYINETDGIRTINTNEGYKERLRIYLNECPGVEKKIQRMSYTLNSMQDLLIGYYVCKGVGPDFQKKKEKNKSELGIFAGLSLTKLRFNSPATAIHEVAYTSFPQSTAFAGGVFYNVYLARNLNKFSINNELIYSSYKTDGIYENYSTPVTTKKTTITFDFSYIKLNTLFRYTYPVNMAYIYINGGISNGWAVREKNLQKEVTLYNNTETVKEGPALNDVRKYEQSYIIGLGTKYKNYSFEARFESGNGMSEYSNLNSAVKRYFFLLGYRF